MIKLISEFLAKPPQVKWLLIRAMKLSWHYKRQIANVPFKDFAAQMGTAQYETPVEHIDDERIQQVRWAAYAVRRWAPWETKCFDQALMAKQILNEYGLPCTLYMGVRPGAGGQLEAHAWLRCGDVYVSGGSGQNYAITGIFGDK